MHDPAPDASVRLRPLNPFSILAGAIAAGYVAALVLLYMRHQWIADAQGRPIVTDFLEVWVAGRFALASTPVSAYDWQAHHAAQAALAGHDFQGVLNWSYPPLFLFVAVLLACLPYAAAFASWRALPATPPQSEPLRSGGMPYSSRARRRHFSPMHWLDKTAFSAPLLSARRFFSSSEGRF